jgi:ferredoxin-type protein NapF
MGKGRFDPTRRYLLSGRRAGVRPPWADVGRFTDLCTRCGACIAACPEAIIVVGGGGFPEVDFRRGECTFCRACADACPEPVFDLAAPRPWEVVVRIGDACLALRGVVCQTCRDVCPEEGAIRFELAYRNAPQPRVEPDACTGCGACVAACPAAAITVAERGTGGEAAGG